MLIKLHVNTHDAMEKPIKMLLPCIKPTKLIDEATRRAVRFEREIFEKTGSRCKPTATALQSK